MNSQQMRQRLAVADLRYERHLSDLARRRAAAPRWIPPEPRQGPCACCGQSGPRGLFEARNHTYICAVCEDDCTGYSAAHGTTVTR